MAQWSQFSHAHLQLPLQMLQEEARSKVTIKIIKATHSCNMFFMFLKGGFVC
jgi:hypothetical protein